MQGKMKQIGLLSVGAVAGLLISIGISALAQREARPPLPLEELRLFSDVFAPITAPRTGRTTTPGPLSQA